jgi:multidrug efflux system outer membrane protein
MLNKALWMGVVVLLAACAQPQPYVRPDLPVPTQWPAALGQVPVESEAAGKVHWKTYFPDPRLQALIAIALNNNRDLRIAAARVQEARAQVDLAAAERLPSINLQGGATFSGSPGELLRSGTPSVGRRFDLSLNTVAFEADFWGRLARLNGAAKSTFLATQEAQRSFELSLVAEVANTYFTQLQLEEWSRLARDTLELREQSFMVVSRGRDLGGSYDFEVAQTQAAMESARASVDAIAHQWTTTTNRLYFLLGEVPQNLPAGWDLQQQGVDSVLVAGLPGDVLLLRPDVMAAELRLQAAQANVEAARAAFLPRVLLTSGVGVASQGLSTLLQNAAWNFVPTLTLPLFDGGRQGANQDIAQARKVAAVADYEKTIQLAFREVADLLSARAALAKQMRSANISEQAQQRRLEIAMARNRIGLTGYLDVLDGQRELLLAQLTSAQIRRAQMETAAQLYKALGGGA